MYAASEVPSSSVDFETTQAELKRYEVIEKLCKRMDPKVSDILRERRYVVMEFEYVVSNYRVVSHFYFTLRIKIKI